MLSLRTAVIMKTDLRASTVTFRELREPDLDAALDAHRELVSDIASRHGGEIVKPEGDAFWVIFPSVTAACRAALAMRAELELSQPGKGDDRLAMRLVITLGDVMLRDETLVGDAVVMAARIESLTPPNEIYLSQGAWLALKVAEIGTSFVGAFPLKGFDEQVPVYRVDSTYRTRVFEDQYMVCTDLLGFGKVRSLATVEKVFDELMETTEVVCREFDGTIRFSTGDSYCLTFVAPELAMRASEQLSRAWGQFEQREALECGIKVGVHKGSLNAYRSFVFGRDVAIAFTVESVLHDRGIAVTEPVRKDLAGTKWGERLSPIDLTRGPAGLRKIGVYQLEVPDSS